ncbi:MAG: hypothetical protein HRU38_20120 [Saccharospirillaceae bacterium]|nr:hypothetical protein [Pseudomonadales bacterium]NRB80939.1 hypothetical protein [Saccharospirillaceae bacterium]
MLLYQDISETEQHDCPYIQQQAKETFFLAKEVDSNELDHLFNLGWRRFAYYYFKPACENCRQCTPIRVPINDFKASKSQRRTLNKANKQPEVFNVVFADKNYHPDIYAIYKSHNTRFEQACDSEQSFIDAHYNDTCPSMQSEYYLGNKLIAVGFMDISDNSISSSYFIYNTDYEYLNLGTLSVLKEIEYAKKLGMTFYHLGYWIKDNKSMAYKNKFHPHELMDWKTGDWQLIVKG